MQLIHPRPPKRPLGILTDGERKILGGPVWDLRAAQQGMQLGHLRPMTTQNVSDDLNTDLGWSLTDVKNGFQMLRNTHYNASEWVWLQGAAFEPLPADSYLLPCKIVPNDEGDPSSDVQVYMKFTLPDPRRQVFFVSVHPSH